MKNCRRCLLETTGLPQDRRVTSGILYLSMLMSAPWHDITLSARMPPTQLLGVLANCELYRILTNTVREAGSMAYFIVNMAAVGHKTSLAEQRRSVAG